MKTQFDLGQYRQFLSPKVFSLFYRGVFVGAGLFAIEFAFAFGLQAFLLGIGVARRESVWLPQWVPQNNLLHVMGFLLAVACLRGVMQWTQEYLRGATNEHFKFIQRSRLLSWAFNLSSASTSQTTTLFSERTNMAGMAMQHLQTIFILGSTTLFMMASLFWISVPLTLVTVTVLALLVIPFKLINRRVRASGEGVAESWDVTNRRLVMSIRNLLLLRIYGLEKTEEGRAQKTLGDYLGYALKYWVISGFLLAFPQIVGVVVICVITYIANTRFGMAPGILVSYFYLLVRLLQNTSNVAQTYSYFTFQLPNLRELREWWQTSFRPVEQALQGSAATKPRTGGASKGLSDRPAIAWNIQGVQFGFEQSKKDLFSEFDLDIPEGKCLVISGPSGTGKSTLLNLLLAQVQPKVGQIDVKLNGKFEPLEIVKSDLLSSIGYVGPESFLVEGTVYQNLVYGLDEKPTPEQIEQALRLAECDFIDQLELGLEHPLSEQGGGLSAGQKQRLSLARALLREPRALILDEATSNLDHQTESRLVETLRNLKGQTTLVVVTHRPAMLALADHTLEL